MASYSAGTILQRAADAVLMEMSSHPTNRLPDRLPRPTTVAVVEALRAAAGELAILRHNDGAGWLTRWADEIEAADTHD